MKQTEALFNKLYSPERVSEGFDKYDMLTMGKESLASYKAGLLNVIISEIKDNNERIKALRKDGVDPINIIGIAGANDALSFIKALLEDNPTEK